MLKKLRNEMKKNLSNSELSEVMKLSVSYER